jgi:hypothetical protein
VLQAVFLLVPFLALGATYAFVQALDGPAERRPRLLRIAVGCLAGAIVLGGGGVLVGQHDKPSVVPVSSNAAVT